MSPRIMNCRGLIGSFVAAFLVSCQPGTWVDTDDGGALQGGDAGAGGWGRDAGAVGPPLDSGVDGGHGGDGGVDAPSEDAGVDPPVDAGPKPSCTGKPGALRGKVPVSVNVGGAVRTFIYYAPSSIDPNEPVPLVLSPHGFAMSAEDMYVITGFKEIADREGFVAVFPQGNLINPWNVGLGVSGAGALVNSASANDQGFVDAIIEFVGDDQCIDPKRIFVSGFSMGGYFSNEIGCLRDDIASVGPHSGGSHDLTECPGTIKPVIIFHGDQDALITYQDNGVLARDRWVARNGCSSEVDSRPVYGGTCDYNRGCPPHGQVALCHFDGMAHAWAGGLGPANSDPDRERASELAWKFWQDYAW